jgi:diguanylate cyclase (GGDEF)-like protein
MKSFKHYRKPLTDSEIKGVFAKEGGAMFDPEITAVAIAMLDDGFELKSMTSNYQTDLDKNGNAILHRVISEYTDEIKIESQKDSLTGLWDRKYTESAINEYIERDGGSGVLYMIDMDNFKQINDRFGHIKGDEVLVKFADAIRKNSREDDILCRIGGDEFIVFCKGQPGKLNPKQKAEAIIQTLKDEIVLDDFEFSASIGAALAPADGTNFAELYSNSDKALYYVKQNGKGGSHFYSDIDKTLPQENNSCETNADLNFIKNINESNLGNDNGTEPESFKNIYSFVEKYISRTQQDVELVLLTITDQKGEVPDVLSLKQSSEILNKALCENVRRGDIFTGFSSSQYVVILMNVTPGFGEVVAERIKSKFNAIKGELNTELHYNVQAL